MKPVENLVRKEINIFCRGAAWRPIFREATATFVQHIINMVVMLLKTSDIANGGFLENSGKHESEPFRPVNIVVRLNEKDRNLS